MLVSMHGSKELFVNDNSAMLGEKLLRFLLNANKEVHNL